MEATAAAVGMTGKLYYVYPTNQGPPPAMINALKALHIDSRIVTDIHNDGYGAVGTATALFASDPNFKESAANLEVLVYRYLQATLKPGLDMT